MQVGHSVAKALPVASGATMRAPGASTSGLAKPSWVVASTRVGRELVVEVSLLPCSSSAPTVITYGSFPGA